MTVDVTWKERADRAEAELDAAGKRIESLVIEAGAYDDLLAEMRERAEKAEAERDAAKARAERLEKALETIAAVCDDEINARFAHHSKSFEELGRNSRVYHLLVVPRNMARAALGGASGEKA